MSRRILIAVTFSLLAGTGASFAAPSVSQILDGLSSIQFDSSTGFALGDTLAVTSPSSPLQRCMDYDQTADVKVDTPGSVSSSMNVYLVKTLDDLERTTNFSFSTSASMGFDFGKALGAKGDTNQNGKLEQFVHNERQSLLLIIEATADQGRDYISDFKLRKKFSDLIAVGKVQDFVAQCGTHFIRGVSKRSGLRLTFNITNLNESSKRLISYHFDSTGSANASMMGITANAKASVSADVSDTLKLASNFGKITYEVQATGGLGIGTLGKTLKAADLSNLTDFRKIMDAMADATQDFGAKNAAPDKFILVPHPQIKPSDYKFDPKRYDVLGRIYKAVLRVNEQATLYDSYKTANYGLWDKYFRVYTDKIAALKTSLLKQYTNCRDQGKCDEAVPDAVDGLILSDITYNGKLRAVCPLGNAQRARINSQSSSAIEYLSMVTIDWTGQIRFFPDIDINGAELYRITPGLVLEKLPLDVRKQITWEADPRKSDQGRAFVSVAYLTTDVSKAVTNGIVDVNYLTEFRNNAARSIYFIRLPLMAGFQAEEIFGFPEMKGCKVMDEAIE
jgi:hypothetical protein